MTFFFKMVNAEKYRTKEKLFLSCLLKLLLTFSLRFRKHTFWAFKCKPFETFPHYIILFEKKNSSERWLLVISQTYF